MSVFYQDIKSRMVSVWLFALAGLCFAMLHVLHSEIETVLYYIGANLVIVTIVLLILFAYARLKMKLSFVNESFGLGDIVFFIVLALGFATPTFVLLFVFAIFSALLMHLLLPKKEESTVPLAGYMALFFVGTTCVSFFVDSNLWYQW